MVSGHEVAYESKRSLLIFVVVAFHETRHVKAQGDYKDEPTPTVCANLDGARCGIIYESAQDFARGYAALENHPRLTPKRASQIIAFCFDIGTIWTAVGCEIIIAFGFVFVGCLAGEEQL